MTANATLSKQLALALYLVLTPLISLAIALFAPLPLMSIALLLLLVPSTAAILITLITEGGKGAAGLLKKIVQWRIDLKWYAITLALSLGIIPVTP